jgi:hypothetical protein
MDLQSHGRTPVTSGQGRAAGCERHHLVAWRQATIVVENSQSRASPEQSLHSVFGH